MANKNIWEELGIKDVDQRYKILQDIFETNGNFSVLDDDDKPRASYMTVRDAFSVPDAPSLIPKVFSTIIKEAAEPLLAITPLFTRIRHKYEIKITAPAVGALRAYDIAESGQVPEQTLSIGGSVVTINTGKVGAAAKFTEEMLDNAAFDVVGWHIRALGRALARKKEEKSVECLLSTGITIFDNENVSDSTTKRNTSGRNSVGAHNGSITMDDIFEMYASIMTNGFMPDVLIVHPLTWITFVQDPILRAFTLASGSGTYFANWTGNPSLTPPNPNGPMGGLGPSKGQNINPSTSELNEYSQIRTGAPVLPRYFPFPLRIVVSPFIPMDPRTRVTNMILADSNELGVLLVGQEPVIGNHRDFFTDLQYVRIIEKYGFGILNEGQGIAVAKNVKAVSNAFITPIQPTLDISGSLEENPASNSVLGVNTIY